MSLLYIRKKQKWCFGQIYRIRGFKIYVSGVIAGTKKDIKTETELVTIDGIVEEFGIHIVLYDCI